MYIQYDEDFSKFCRVRFERIQVACDILGIINDEEFEDFVERNYDTLYEDYINSIDRTIH